MSFNKRLREARIDNGITQDEIAEMLEISKSTYSGYETGRREPSMLMIRKLMDILKVDANYLMDEDTADESLSVEQRKWLMKLDSLSENSLKIVIDLADRLLDLEDEFRSSSGYEMPMPMRLPFYYGRPSAGTGTEILTNDESVLTSFEETSISKKSDFVVRVDGNSMLPKFADRDFIGVKKADAVDIGEIGLFVVNGEMFVKQKQENYLHSLNSDYQDIPITENDNVFCIGKVIGKVEKI